MTYILIDTANLFFKSKHVVRSNDPELKVGMAFHIIFTSIAKTFRDFGGSHVVFALEGRSWRKDFYEPYKRNRAELRAQLSAAELEEEKMFNEAFSSLIEYLKTETNCTVVRHPRCEADDFIARWIQTHPNDKHVIISSDSDFYQLINENVSQYNGISNQHITINGVFDDRGKPVIDNKTKLQKTIGDPKWVLFEKCIRGDVSDNVFSAYPGARVKGSKNKVGLLDAYEDMGMKGFNWNNFMLQRWTDHDGVEHKVLDDYTRNKTLIDLTQQPQNIIEELDKVITEATLPKEVTQVGIRFMRFCGKYNLQKLSERANDHTNYLNSKYNT